MIPPSVTVFSALGARAQPPTITRLMALALENPTLLSLAAGFTDNRTLPVTGVRAAVEQLTRDSADPACLQYGSNAGRPGLRRLLAARLAAQDPRLHADTLAEQCFITNGSQQALYLAMQILCDPEDIVLVDRPSYFVYLELLKGFGVEALSLPVDDDGCLDLATLGALLTALEHQGRRHRLKAVYFVSYFSNPSGRSLSAAEKAGLAQTLRAHDCVVPVVEDAAYRDLHYREPEAVPGILGDPAWDGFPRLYLSTLTKPFASGLKVGYGFCDHEGWRRRMLHVKGQQDFGSANFNQAVMEQVIADGGLDRQLECIRPAYEKKMRALHEALVAEGLPALGWRWTMPRGGLYLWLEAPPGVDTRLDRDFCRACVAAGVLYVPGELCFGDTPTSRHVRLSFGVLAEADLVEAARRFGGVARDFASRADTSTTAQLGV
jgi:2-aminoadipate transaminase